MIIKQRGEGGEASVVASPPSLAIIIIKKLAKGIAVFIEVRT
jgi:hypothetical protein